MILSNILFVLIFMYVGGESILFVNRDSTISTIAPVLRYIYPFGIVFMCGAGIYAIWSIFCNPPRPIYWMHLLIVYLVSLVYAQRGFLILFCFIAYALLVFLQPKKLLGKNLFLVMTFLLCLIFAKDFLVYFFMNDSSGIDLPYTFVEHLLKRPDGDQSEVWMLIINYVDSNGYHYGGTLVNNLLNFLPHQERVYLGFENAQDILNGFFNPVSYFKNGYGFNVTLPMELFLNFGVWGLPFIMLAGIFMSKAIHEFNNNVILEGKSLIAESFKLYSIWTITTSLAGIQWALIFYIFFRAITFLNEKLY